MARNIYNQKKKHMDDRKQDFRRQEQNRDRSRERPFRGDFTKNSQRFQNCEIRQRNNMDKEDNPIGDATLEYDDINAL